MDPAVGNKKSGDEQINRVGKIVDKRARTLPLTKGTFSHENNDLAHHEGSIDDARHTNPILLLDDGNRSNQIEGAKQENFHPHVSLVEHRAGNNKVIKVGGPKLVKGLHKGLWWPDWVFASLLQHGHIRNC